MQKMNMTRLIFFLTVVLFAAEIFLIGCRAVSSSLSLPNRTQADDLFTQFIEKNLGTDWYGIYIQDCKAGYLKTTTRLERAPNSTSYIIQLSGTIHTPSKAETDEMKIHTVAVFSAQPPYSMIRYSDRIIHKDDISETKITWTSKGYQASVTQGKETQTRMIGAFEYSLKDYTAVQRWITRNPKAGAKINYPYLNLETLTLEKNTSRIAATHEARIAGVKTSYYDVVTTGFDGLEVQEEFGADGKPYRIVIGGLFECRLEPQSLATHMDISIGLFVKNTVPINQPLGDSETVTLLKLLIDKKSGALLKDAPGQSVTHDPANDFFIVTLNSTGGYQAIATDEEIKKNLAETTHVLINHPKIIGLTHKAVGDAETPAEAVDRLVKFVYQYIEDDYTANPLTLLDIISKKKGDCSEHAKLFTAMVRSFGVPCRTVGGLVYLGDEFQEFGLHAWNEVVIDGVWVPVDPTWGQTSVDATHIRFPVEISKEWQVMAAIPKMKLRVLHVEHKK
jgi:transglutaminase-like putative cysteine protease